MTVELDLDISQYVWGVGTNIHAWRISVDMFADLCTPHCRHVMKGTLSRLPFSLHRLVDKPWKSFLRHRFAFPAALIALYIVFAALFGLAPVAHANDSVGWQFLNGEVSHGM